MRIAKTIALTLLALMIAAPMTAHAGAVTVYNKDCRTVLFKPWPVTRSRVDVHIWNFTEGCSDGWMRIAIGESKTMEVKEHYGNSEDNRCLYYHEAAGTSSVLHGRQDVYGDENASVTCKENLAKVCICKKD